LFAARLQSSGQEVTVLARGQRLSDIREHGIVLEDAITGLRTVTRVHALAQLGPDDVYDLVLVVMRKNQVPAILPALAANRHVPSVLFLMNNAAGPGELVAALGRERVLLGFPGAGGVREGHVVRFLAGAGRTKAKVTCGELDGRQTPRLRRIAAALEAAGFAVDISRNIDAWLKNHVALVSPIANALYLAAGNNYRLARTRDGLVLMIRAIREGFGVLRALGLPILPTRLRILSWLPEPALVALAPRALDNELAEIALAGHANAARDELKHLADEFRALAGSISIPIPAIEHLYTYIDPQVSPVAKGSARIRLDWRAVVVGGGLLAGLILVYAVSAKRAFRETRVPKEDLP
jgi:2-dehydropantoate 2-reductase